MMKRTGAKPVTLGTSESTEESLPIARSKSSYGFTSSLCVLICKDKTDTEGFIFFNSHSLHTVFKINAHTELIGASLNTEIVHKMTQISISFHIPKSITE